jgi:hypothetical protein
LWGGFQPLFISTADNTQRLMYILWEVHSSFYYPCSNAWFHNYYPRRSYSQYHMWLIILLSPTCWHYERTTSTNTTDIIEQVSVAVDLTFTPVFQRYSAQISTQMFRGFPHSISS